MEVFVSVPAGGKFILQINQLGYCVIRSKTVVQRHLFLFLCILFAGIIVLAFLYISGFVSFKKLVSCFKL